MAKIWTGEIPLIAAECVPPTPGLATGMGGNSFDNASTARWRVRNHGLLRLVLDAARIESMPLATHETREDLESFPSNDLRVEIVPLFAQSVGDKHVRFRGTAFCWGEAPWFLTARHVVGPREVKSAPLMVAIRPQNRTDGAAFMIHPIAQVYELDGGDAALLRIPTATQRKPVFGMHVTFTDVMPGADVWCQGYPLVDEELDPVSEQMKWSMGSRFLSGRITRVYRSREERGEAMIETDFALPPGASGAPLIRSVGCQTVGIVTGTRTTIIGDDRFAYGQVLPLWRIWDEVSKTIADAAKDGSSG